MSRGRVQFALRVPPDRRVGDRLRRAARRIWLLFRALLLHPCGALRRRLRRPPAPSSVRRVLVVRTDRLGDMALTSAAIQDLHEHYRHAAITVLAPPGPVALLEGHPAVARTVAWDGGALPPDLVGAFDVAVDFSSDEALRGARLVGASRARCRTGLRGRGRQIYFNLKGPRADRRRHVCDLNRDLAAALGADPRTPRPVLHVTPEERGAAAARLAALGAASPRVALHPGGHYETQRWPPERFARLIGLLTGRTGAACVVVFGPDEASLAARIRAATPDALSLPTPTVRELMAALAACDLFIGGNSGPLHLAGALGVPTVSLSGPTDPARFAPRGPADRVLREEVPCSPCGRGRCWHHTCLRLIEPEQVLAAAEEALADMTARREAR